MKAGKQTKRSQPPRRQTSGSDAQAVLGPVPRTQVDPRWAWHFRVLLELRRRLQAERQEQLDEAAEPLEPHSMDIADSATDEFDHDLALAHLSAEQDALYEVEAALRRIREGSYGICEATEKRISAARLRAIPWTRYCRATQARLEKANGGGRERLGKVASLRAVPGQGFEEAETAGELKEEPEPEDESLRNVPSPRAARAPLEKQKRGPTRRARR